MDGQTSPEQPAEGQMSTPTPPRYLLVGLALLGFIVVILVGALLLNDRLRARVGIEPAPTAIASQQTPVGAAASSAQATSAPSAIAAATATSSSTIITTTATATTTTAMVTAVVIGNPTAIPTPTGEVEQAYLRYWEVYSDALLNLDASKMNQVAAENGLSRVQEEVADFLSRKVAVRVRVTHSFVVFDATDIDAKVYDEMLDRSFLVDPATKQPSDSPNQGTRVKDTFILKKIDGTWKVVEHLRHEG